MLPYSPASLHVGSVLEWSSPFIVAGVRAMNFHMLMLNSKSLRGYVISGWCHHVVTIPASSCSVQCYYRLNRFNHLPLSGWVWEHVLHAWRGRAMAWREWGTNWLQIWIDLAMLNAKLLNHEIFVVHFFFVTKSRHVAVGEYLILKPCSNPTPIPSSTQWDCFGALGWMMPAWQKRRQSAVFKCCIWRRQSLT